MDPILQTMAQLIGPVGFRLMGARELTYANETLCLSWRMGDGSRQDQVAWLYDIGTDTYTLAFTPLVGEPLTLRLVYVDDVLDPIEEKTGFYPTFRPRR